MKRTGVPEYALTQVHLATIAVEALVILLLVSLCGAAFSKLATATFPVTCRSAGSFAHAQTLLHLYPRLDGDKDGVACENLR